MTEILVDACHLCPLWDMENNACQVVHRDIIGVDLSPPDWCPLRKGPIVIQLASCLGIECMRLKSGEGGQ